ncbi:MAG: diguanylate cyclase [Desulfobacteraceae bacterium]|nr:diguanylate cyclase [Desulfobacteraceae bacterium]
MSEKILVVDDDFMVRDAIEQYLSQHDYQTFAAQSAKEALEFLQQYPIEVMITDIMLSSTNVLELTETVKKSYNTAVIIMTGYIDDYFYEEAIRKGADEFVMKPVQFEELRLRLKRLLRERRLEREHIQMLDALKKLSITDDLTRLYNSRHFYQQVETEINRHTRYDRPLSLLLLDIDHFKMYNDKYGHPEGDRILSHLGKLISEFIRDMDTAYRYGGEEFTVILPETNSKDAVKVCKRIMNEVKTQKFNLPEGTAPVTLSIGVTQYNPGESINEFVSRADRAMYMSKEKGRNRISLLLP